MASVFVSVFLKKLTVSNSASDSCDVLRKLVRSPNPALSSARIIDMFKPAGVRFKALVIESCLYLQVLRDPQLPWSVQQECQNSVFGTMSKQHDFGTFLMLRT